MITPFIDTYLAAIPRIGECVFLSAADKKRLNKKIKATYKSTDKLDSFFRVDNVLYKSNEDIVHISIAETTNQDEMFEDIKDSLKLIRFPPKK